MKWLRGALAGVLLLLSKYGNRLVLSLLVLIYSRIDNTSVLVLVDEFGCDCWFGLIVLLFEGCITLLLLLPMFELLLLWFTLVFVEFELLALIIGLSLFPFKLFKSLVAWFEDVSQ